jgi:hypothetical protein
MNTIKAWYEKQREDAPADQPPLPPWEDLSQMDREILRFSHDGPAVDTPEANSE